MTEILCACLAAALVVVVFALCREVRLRKALVRLLQKLLTRWRNL